MRKDEDPGVSPRRRHSDSYQEKRKSGGTMALAAAAIAIALVMVFGGEELNAISRGYNSQQAKLHGDFEMLADGLRDLSDLIPELESNLETAVEGLTGTLVMRFGELWRNIEGKLQSVEREQRNILQVAQATQPPPQVERTVVKSGTFPEFSIATIIDERVAARAFSESDTEWRLMRRYFLNRQAQAAASDPSGAPPRPGALQVVDANCVVGMHLWPTSSAIGAASYAMFAASHGRRVLCFESEPRHLELINATLQENKQLSHLVWVLPATLGYQEVEVREVGEQGKKERRELHTRPLDDFVFGPVDLLRVDVVGGRELAVLQGSRVAIEEGRVAALVTTLKPLEWERAGFTIEEGVRILAWIQQQRPYRAYIVFPSRLLSGGSCPAQLMGVLGLVSPAGAEVAIRQAHDRGDEAAQGKLAKIGKVVEGGGEAPSFEESLRKLLEAMREHEWSCTLWMEEGVQGPISSGPPADLLEELEGGGGTAEEGQQDFMAETQQAQQQDFTTGTQQAQQQDFTTGTQQAQQQDFTTGTQQAQQQDLNAGAQQAQQQAGAGDNAARDAGMGKAAAAVAGAVAAAERAKRAQQQATAEAATAREHVGGGVGGDVVGAAGDTAGADGAAGDTAGADGATGGEVRQNAAGLGGGGEGRDEQHPTNTAQV